MDIVSLAPSSKMPSVAHAALFGCFALAVMLMASCSARRPAHVQGQSDTNGTAQGSESQSGTSRHHSLESSDHHAQIVSGDGNLVVLGDLNNVVVYRLEAPGTMRSGNRLGTLVNMLLPHADVTLLLASTLERDPIEVVQRKLSEDLAGQIADFSDAQLHFDFGRTSNSCGSSEWDGSGVLLELCVTRDCPMEYQILVSAAGVQPAVAGPFRTRISPSRRSRINGSTERLVAYLDAGVHDSQEVIDELHARLLVLAQADRQRSCEALDRALVELRVGVRDERIATRAAKRLEYMWVMSHEL